MNWAIASGVGPGDPGITAGDPGIGATGVGLAIALAGTAPGALTDRFATWFADQGGAVQPAANSTATAIQRNL
ncbi:MAG: hypothetical protein HQ567_34045 [Candidatus Nealsonbacteria bacterium]|nr:hypothetical protein [Candidatus Nealsonbacteria bacterium]